MSGDYKVGKGKPPQGTKFRKGRSGNPKGRPKRATDKLDITTIGSVDQHVLDIGNRPMKVITNGKASEVTTAEALQMRRSQTALSGHRLAGKELSDELRAAEAAAGQLKREIYLYWKAYVRRPNRAAALGGFPSPLDIEIDPIAQAVRFHGPMEREEQPLFELPRLLRDIVLAHAELLIRRHGVTDPAAARMIVDASCLHGKVPASLGGPGRAALPGRASHQLTACIVALRARTDAQLKTRIVNVQHRFDHSALTIGLGCPDRSTDAGMNDWFHAPETGLKARGSIARNPTIRTKVVGMLADGHSLDAIAKSVAEDGITRAALARFVRLYRAELERVKAVISAESTYEKRTFERETSRECEQCWQTIDEADRLRDGRCTSAKEAMLRAIPIVETAAPVPQGASPAVIDLIRREILGLKN